MTSGDPFDLQRFVDAQAQIFPLALGEMENGRKRSHWMWFVFPQLRGLGRSSTAQFYGIASLAEARAYLAHPLLGARLRQCVAAALKHSGRPLIEIFGSPDDLKFRSSMTLFARAAEEAALDSTDFNDALKKYFNGEGDPLTAAMLR